MSHFATGIPHVRGQYDETPLPPEALELLSDVMLHASGLDGDCPSYTETLLAGRARRAAKSEYYFEEAVCAARGPEAPAIEMPDESQMSEPDRTIWRLYSEGLAVMHIADRVGIPRRLVHRRIHNIMARAMRRTPLDDLREVYHSEVARHEYRKPTHCPTHPCEKLGYCRYRV